LRVFTLVSFRPWITNTAALILEASLTKSRPAQNADRESWYGVEYCADTAAPSEATHARRSIR